jgi:hypothetical protein
MGSSERNPYMSLTGVNSVMPQKLVTVTDIPSLAEFYRKNQRFHQDIKGSELIRAGESIDEDVYEGP